MRYSRVLLLIPMFIVTDRIYPLAPTYLFSKIISMIGSDIQTLCVLAFTLFIIPVGMVVLKKIVWIIFVWRVVALIWLCVIQFTADHAQKAIDYELGIRSSGAFLISPYMGIVQDLFWVFIGIWIYRTLTEEYESLKGLYYNG